MLPLVFSWFLTFGYIPEMSENVIDSEAIVVSEDSATIAEVGLSAEWRGFELSGSVATYQFFAPEYFRFFPYRADYKIGLSYTYRYITIGIEHECDHPIISNRDYSSRFDYLSSQTRIYATIRGASGN